MQDNFEKCLELIDKTLERASRRRRQSVLRLAYSHAKWNRRTCINLEDINFSLEHAFTSFDRLRYFLTKDF